MDKYNRVYATVDLDAIRNNFRSIKTLAGGKRVMVVIKADGYGHGAVRTAQLLRDEADYFAVATIEEATELRSFGIETPVLILGYDSPRFFETAIKNNITQTIYRLDSAKKLSETAVRLNKTAKIHIAVDTGMNRIGFNVSGESAKTIKEIANLPGIELEGVFTHFATADEADKIYANKQAEKFKLMYDMLDEEGIAIPLLHISNSAAIIDFPGLDFDMVRAGIIVYGLYPSKDVNISRLPIKPAMELKSHVIDVRHVHEGEGVSYGRTYVTTRDTVIATVHVGYADGYPRLLSNRGRVLIRGKSAPIIGRVCMDQLMVDATYINGVSVDDVVTLIGRDGDEYISAEEIAFHAETINYEIVCGFSKRVPRVYGDES